ncbi:MAG: carbonic anhydrase [bacterium]
MKNKENFSCAINCMDGRVQDAVKNYIQKNYNVDFVDMITEPGPNKILAENTDASVVSDIKKCVDISVNHHGSKVIAIVGHFGCAGNPAEKQEQVEHLKKAEQVVIAFGFDTKIILLWVEGDWKTVERIM